MFGLTHRGELPGSTENEFEHLQTRLRGLWLVEHNEDGTHNLEEMGVAEAEHTHVVADLPDTVAYTDVANTFTVDQTIQADLIVDAGNIYMDAATALYFGGTAATDLRYYGSATHAIIRPGSTGVTIQNNAGNADILTIAQATGAMVFPQSGGTITERGRSTPMGEWTSVAHAGGNFTGNGAMTWTVEAADQVTFQYMLIGKTIFVNVYISGSSVGGTPNTSLQIAVPGGFSSAKSVSGAGWALDNGVGTAALVGLSGTTMAVLRADLANWTASANNTQVRFMIAFEIS